MIFVRLRFRAQLLSLPAFIRVGRSAVIYFPFLPVTCVCSARGYRRSTRRWHTDSCVWQKAELNLLVETMEHALSKLFAWFCTNKMKINAARTQIQCYQPLNVPDAVRLAACEHSISRHNGARIHNGEKPWNRDGQKPLASQSREPRCVKVYRGTSCTNPFPARTSQTCCEPDRDLVCDVNGTLLTINLQYLWS